MTKSLITLILTLFLTNIAYATNAKPKSSIKANGIPIYFEKPADVDLFSEMFSNGNIYGRLRSNNFYFKWKDQDPTHDNHLINGIGASLVYQSATYSNVDFLLGGYASRAFFEGDDDIGLFKPGKDTFSRYNYKKDGDKHMFVLGQASLNYSGIEKTDIRIGRQFVETFYTASNDTKMIPNTFDGVTIDTKIISDSKIKLAYLAKQKLRDHTQNHNVLMYDDRNTAEYSQWDGNDDSAMHRGLTYNALKANGKPTDAALMILDFKNNSIENLTISGAVYHVEELLSQSMTELNYNFNYNGFSIAPGIRYVHQFDNGAGKVGGASYLNDTTDYKNPDSLDSQMLAARVVTKINNYKINLAYSNVFNESDLITPWRGFPTAGYTRSMGIYNWRANTKSYRLELVHNNNKNSIYRDPFIQASVLYTDGDSDKKAGNDYWYYYFGIIQNIPSFESLQYKLRLGYADLLHQSKSEDLSYLDARFEFNYMF